MMSLSSRFLSLRWTALLLAGVGLAACSDSTAVQSPAPDAGLASHDAQADHSAVLDASAPKDSSDEPVLEAGADVSADSSLPLDAASDASADAVHSGWVAVVDTSKGTFRVSMFTDDAPITTENFRRYVEAKFYDGLIFHRVIPNFMIQGGGFLPGMKYKAALFPAIQNEAKPGGPSNRRGTIAMARTNAPHSATSQFFINTVDNPGLDADGDKKAGYAVFGEVLEGMDVIDEISRVTTGTVGSYEDVPVVDVVINSIVVEAQ